MGRKLIQSAYLWQTRRQDEGRETLMKIKTQADIAELEKLPVGERIRHKNVLEIFQDSGARHADRVAFRSLSGTTPNDPARDVTYAEMLRRVIQTPHPLHASRIGPHETLSLLPPGLPETFFAPWGAGVYAPAQPAE